MSVRSVAVAFFASLSASIAPPAAAADWADPAKVLRIAFPIDVSGLDPAGVQETYASIVDRRILEGLYEWDYLARPYKFVPSIATGMPEVSPDGKVWTIDLDGLTRIRTGERGVDAL